MFQELSELGLLIVGWSIGVVWGDFNSDGEVDFYVVNYFEWSMQNYYFCDGVKKGLNEVCLFIEFNGVNDLFWFSNGDGMF